MRFEDSPDLFGESGGGTYGDIICEWCGKVYNGREDKHGNCTADDSISFTDFGGKQICDCCFETIENAVLHRMPYIIAWYTRLLKTRRSFIEGQQSELRQLAKVIGEST